MGLIIPNSAFWFRLRKSSEGALANSEDVELIHKKLYTYTCIDIEIHNNNTCMYICMYTFIYGSKMHFKIIQSLAVLSKAAVIFCCALKDPGVLDPLMVPLQFVT